MLYFWIAVAVFSAFIEIITVGNLICIWFSVGALFAALLAWLAVADIWQYIVFFVVSITVLIIVRPLAYKFLRGNAIATNSDRVIGVNTVVTKEITELAWGEVTINGMPWSAISNNGTPIAVGSKVTVVAIDGAKVVVKKL